MPVQPTTCAVLEQKDFQDLMMQFPKMGLALTTILAERVESASQQVGIEFISLAKLNFDERVLALLPQTMMVQHKVIPVAFANNRLTLAMVNPNNIIALDDIRRVIKGVMIEPVVTTDEDFRKFMNTTFSDLMNKQAVATGKTGSINTADIVAMVRDFPAFREVRARSDRLLEHRSQPPPAPDIVPVNRLGCQGIKFQLRET